MGTHYGLKCEKCDVGESWFLRGASIVYTAVKLWPAIKIIRQDETGYFSVAVLGQCEQEDCFQFLQEHYDHESLVLYDEYGSSFPGELPPVSPVETPMLVPYTDPTDTHEYESGIPSYQQVVAIIHINGYIQHVGKLFLDGKEILCIALDKTCTFQNLDDYIELTDSQIATLYDVTFKPISFRKDVVTPPGGNSREVNSEHER